MKQFLLILFLVIVPLNSMGVDITFTTVDKNPIDNVRCTGFDIKNDSIGEYISNAKGQVSISNDSVSYILATREGYNNKIIACDSLTSNINIIELTQGVNLKEVVVTPSDITEFGTYTSYRLTQRDMQMYADVLQSLNIVPNLTVLGNGAVFFEGEQNIKILIDGVEATTAEIQSLSKEDVAKVDVYRTPPLRFLVQGISAVMDIRLKSKIHGGNISMNINQAFQSLKGNNSAALFYNYKQSRFQLLYTNENRHYRKFQRTEELDYEFDGIQYVKKKRGLDSKSHLDDNKITMSYQINKANNFLNNVKAGVSTNRDGGVYNQEVTAADRTFLATNKLRTGYTRFHIGNYFEKNIGDKGSTLFINFNYQYYDTKYNSSYIEMQNDVSEFQGSQSSYKTHLDAFFSEIQFQLPSNKLGDFSFSLFETYKHSKYVDSYFPFYQTSNVTGGSGQWIGRKGKVNWYVIMGMQWLHTSSIVLPRAHNLVIPTPMANIRWRISRNTLLSFDYSYIGDLPKVAELSETNQWLDNKLVYHGNASLAPYRTHSIGVSFIWNFKYLNMAWRNRFESSPHRICDMYTVTDRYMLQTLVNLSKYRVLNSQLDVLLKPLGNNKLVFWNRIILADLKGSNQEYSWSGYRFQWISDLALNLKHWTVEMLYQYPGKIVEGQLERPRAECWWVSVLYRPMTNLSVGLEWFMPFGQGFRESEYTVNSSPVHANTEFKILDRNNMVSLKFTYNISFGRNRNNASPQYDNIDNDSGILHK